MFDCWNFVSGMNFEELACDELVILLCFEDDDNDDDSDELF